MAYYYVEDMYGPRGNHTGYAVRNKAEIISKSTNRKFGGWNNARKNADYICNSLNNAFERGAKQDTNAFKFNGTPKIDPHLSVLGLDTMPDDLALLKIKYRQSCMSAFHYHGSDTAPGYVDAFHQITNAFNALKEKISY